MSDLDLNTSSSSLSLNTEIVTLEIRAPGQQSGGTVTNFSVSTALLQSFSVATPNTTPQLGIAGVIDTTRFLRNDGQWVTPPVGTGTVTNFLLSSALQAAFSVTSSTTTPTLGITGTIDNTRFLRNDGQWAVPPSGGGGITSIGLVVPSPLSVTPPTLTANGIFTVTWGTGQIPTANLGTGTASVNNYLRGDASWASPVVSLAKTGGTARTGALSLTQGTNVTITDNADGSFTFSASGGGGGAGVSWTSAAAIAVGDLVYGSNPNGVAITAGSTYAFDGSDILFNDIQSQLIATPVANFATYGYQEVGNFLVNNLQNSGGTSALFTRDGLNWRAVSSPLQGLTGAAFLSSNSYVIVNRYVYQTNDFLNFSQVYDGGSANLTSAGLIATSSFLIASQRDSVANSWRVINSSNGSTWNTAISSTGSQFIFEFAQYGNNVIGVPSNTGGAVVYSTNAGSSFTLGASANTSFYRPIVVNSTFCWSNGSQFIYSASGAVIDNITLSFSFGNQVKLVAGSTEALVFGSGSNLIRVSGINGAAVPSQAAITINASIGSISNIMFVNNNHYAFCTTTDSRFVVYKSSNGVSWTLASYLFANPSNSYYKEPYFFWFITQTPSSLVFYSAFFNQLLVTNSEASATTTASLGTYRFLGGESFGEDGLWVRTA